MKKKLLHRTHVKGSKKILDKLVKVFLKNKNYRILLIHVEIQGQYEKDFAKRMLVYYFRIWEKYGNPITSIAILTDDRKNWKPSKIKCRLISIYRLDNKIT
ncbi:MAG: hypothetical protein H7A23_26015 [Leptospiraceae bacterium]|nr:hypothetical protein [Leptospiraceae bacterium]